MDSELLSRELNGYLVSFELVFGFVGVVAVTVGSFKVVQFDKVVTVFGLEYVVTHLGSFSFRFLVEELVVDVLTGKGEGDAVFSEGRDED